MITTNLFYNMYNPRLAQYRQVVDTNHPNNMSFFGMKLGSQGINVFFSGFQWPSTLETLSFDGCQLGDSGLTTLCTYLSQSPNTLKLLNLSGNKLSDACIPLLLDTIANTGINQLILQNNPLSQSSLLEAIQSSKHHFEKLLLKTDEGRVVIEANTTNTSNIRPQ